MKKLFSPFFRHKKIFIPLIFVGLVLLYFLIIAKPKATQVEYIKATRQNISEAVSTSGSIDGSNIANLRFPMGGKLAYLNVKQGDQVDKGQALAGIDTQTLNINLAEAQNTLAADHAALQKVLDDIHLYQYGNGGLSNVGSANETATQRNQRIAAETAVNNAQEAVNAAQKAFQDAVITSPFSGVVTQVNVVAGQNVSPTDIVAQVVDPSQIYFDAQVDESDIGKIQIGQQANVTLNSYGDKIFSGFVETITPTTETTTSGATVVVVRINLGHPDINFVSGLNGQADIVVKSAQNVLTLPIDSIKDDNTIVLNKNNQFVAVPVTLGIESDTDAQIISGISDNQEVVKNPTSVQISTTKSGLGI